MTTVKTVKVWWLAMVLAGGCAVEEPGAAEETTAAEQAATQTDVWHGTWNGSSASASFYTSTGNGYVDAFESKSGQTRFAYLQFSTWSFDPDSQVCFTWTDWWGNPYTYCYYTRYRFAYGWGQIPAGDAQLLPNHARVKTTLPETFGGYQCTIDYSNWVYDCGPAAGGSVDIRWAKDSVYSAFSSGINQYEYGPYTFKTQGSYRSASARAEGSVIGTSFDGVAGYLSDTRGTSVSKSVLQTPRP